MIHTPLSRDYVIYVDFDSTLFNTRQFAEDLRRAVANYAHISYERFIADEEKFQTDQQFQRYNFTQHAASYGLDMRTTVRFIEELTHETDYLYEDSAPFMQRLLADGFKPIILSFGESRFQSAKIATNLKRLVGKTHDAGAISFIVVSDKKAQYISDANPGQRGVLVDDVPEQELPAGFTEIHIDRLSTLKKPQFNKTGYTVSNLIQAEEVIRHLSSDQQADN